MIVQHNMLAMNANNRYGKNIIAKSKSAEKLASGYRINRAADDAAGLEISSRLNKQVKGLNQGLMNAQDGISLCQVADGALSEATDMLQRMNELALQAANGTNSDSDREAIQKEIDQLKSELDRVGESTKFNEEKVFKGDESDDYISTETYRLVNSEAANTGYLTEVYTVGEREHYPCARLDFGVIDEENIKYLVGQKFSFTCSVSCKETFEFTFIDGSGQNDSLNGIGYPNPHLYTIDIHGLKNGEEVVNKVFNYIKEKPADGGGPIIGEVEELYASHSNVLAIEDKATLRIRSTTACRTKELAETKYLNQHNQYGAVDCQIFATPIDKRPNGNALTIQAGSDKDAKVNIYIEHMSSELLGVDELDVTHENGCIKAIEKIEKAILRMAQSRAIIGAQQNRLEHAVLNLGNISENTTAAYSKIKDTDMASEMVKFSNMNIVASANESVIAQANQMNEGVLSLLQ